MRACVWALVVAFSGPALGQDGPRGVFIDRDARDPLSVSRNAGVEYSFIDGRYEVRRDSLHRVTGSYQRRGDTLVITEAEGPWACVTPQTSSAAYRITWDGDAMTLHLVGQDPCNRRRNRLAGVTLVPSKAPTPAPAVSAPEALRDAWRSFWVESDSAGWIDRIFATDVVAEDGNRRMNGINEVRQWLGGQDSRSPQAFPFAFDTRASSIVEKGRYRDVFGAPDGSTRILVGRYQITWVRDGSLWKVREWILR